MKNFNNPIPTDLEWPQQCPFCGDKELNHADSWEAKNPQEKAISISLEEFQCEFCGRAFWI